LSQTALTIDAARSGQGAALVSRFLAERDIEANLLVQITSTMFSGELDFYLLAGRGPKLSPTTKAVSDWFKSKAACELLNS
jgi:LysR family glycine cleavage system transcriptional activator